MPDFNIYLVNNVREEFGTHFADPEKNFIRNGVLDLFQQVATQGKARADAAPVPRRGRGRSAPADHPTYTINVSWVDVPPAASDHYICYFVRTQSQSIIRQLNRGVSPEAQGLTWEVTGQSISEVYIMQQTNSRMQCNNEHLVMVVFHEFLHNRLEMPAATSHPHDVHAEDSTGYGTSSSHVHVTGREADDPATVDDERFTIRTSADRDVVLTEEFDIDVVYASLANPVAQYIYNRPRS